MFKFIKKFVFSSLLFFLMFNSYSQNLKGRLIDSEGKPIPYAHVVWGKSDQGSISNDSGFFKLKIHEGFTTINISSIGFENKSLQLPELSIKKLNIIELIESETSMDEVIVEGTFDSANWYVQQAIKNIPKNYTKRKHSQIAFYREASIRDTTYARMVEAIVLLSEKGINRKSEDTKYEVLQLRKTKDNRKISWRRTLDEWLYQDLGPYTINKANPTKPKGTKNSDINDYHLCNAISDDRRETPTRLLYDEFLKSNYFTIINNYRSNGKEYVEIQTELVDTVKFGYTKHIRPFARIIINKEDKAIVQFEKIQISLTKSIFAINTITDSLKSHYLIKWKQDPADEKYYVQYIRDAAAGTNASRLSGAANFDEVYQSKGKSGFLKQINEWYVIENQDYEKINWRNGASLDEDIYDVEPTERFNISFDDINAMPINPINQKMLKDLTKNGSIDELFIEE